MKNIVLGYVFPAGNRLSANMLRFRLEIPNTNHIFKNQRLKLFCDPSKHLDVFCLLQKGQ